MNRGSLLRGRGRSIVDERVTLRKKEAIQEGMQQFLQQMNSLFTKISDQHLPVGLTDQ